jgi:hypothetical protein
MSGRSRSTACGRGARAACAALLAAALVACGGGPGTVPDKPAMQLSKDSVAFELDAYTPASLSPAADSVGITNPSSTPIPGVPDHVTPTYETLPGWLSVSFAVDGPGYRITIRPTALELLDPGTYRATLAIAWPGASNSPATVAVTLTVHPHPNTWAAGSPTLARTRYSHSTTALLDGGAVTIGGMFAEKTIERLDPATRTWSWASAAAGHASLLQGRFNHTATLLEDGRVFVAGGQSQDGSTPAGTWELWDPRTGAIADHGTLAKDRYDHAAVRLLDGRVLLVGGWRTERVGGRDVLGGTRSCELFDPSTGRSTETGALHGDASEVTTAALLLDGTGRVLVTNELPSAPGAAGAELGAELYDPAAGTWTQVEARGHSRAEHGMVALDGGKVVVFGGFDEQTTPLRSSEVFDPATGHWTAAGDLYAPHLFVPRDAVLLPSGKALVAGGARTMPPPASDAFAMTALVETFDPGTGQWTVSGAIGDGIIFHTVTVLADGTVFALGGVNLYAPDHRPAYFWREPAAEPSE